jgi:hypothetical protein
LNWPRFVRGILVSIFGQDPQVRQFAESLHFRRKQGQSILFDPVEETSRDPSCPINDCLHGVAAPGTIASSIAKCFVLPIARTIASIASRQSANRASAGDLRLRSKEYGCFCGRPIHRASRMIRVYPKSWTHLETRGFPVLSAAVIWSCAKWRRCNWIIWASMDVGIARTDKDGILIIGRQIISWENSEKLK